MAVFAVLLWIVSRDQKDIARDTVSATESIERAYVTISHTPVTVENTAGRVRSEPGGLLWFEVDVKNCGNTPAEVLGGIIAIEIGTEGSSAPRVIPTRKGGFAQLPPAFLVPSNKISIHSIVTGLTEDEVNRSLKFKGELSEDAMPLEMWLVGFVIYRDAFLVDHCGGYARHWWRHGRDLVFDETTAHLNYDRPPTADQWALIQQRRKTVDAE